jgi:putative NADPH-quinone reductase
MTQSPRTLILLFHPDIAHSRANAALAAAAGRVPGVEVADLHALYPDGRIDDDTEVARLLSADRIVLQFPLQWYSTPPLLKAWQDRILTRMFYIDYETEGRRLEGRPIMLAVTAGNTASAYGPGGRNLYPLPDLLRPLQITANRCGLPWTEPFVVFGANKLDADALAAAGRAFAARLQAWSDADAVPPAPVQPGAGEPETPRKVAPPASLAVAALTLPVIVAAEMVLAALSWSSGEGPYSWHLLAGVALIAPIGWIFFSALGLASARMLRPWAVLLAGMGAVHALVSAPGAGRTATGGVIALIGLILLKKIGKRRGRFARKAEPAAVPA